MQRTSLTMSPDGDRSPLLDSDDAHDARRAFSALEGDDSDTASCTCHSHGPGRGRRSKSNSFLRLVSTIVSMFDITAFVRAKSQSPPLAVTRSLPRLLCASIAIGCIGFTLHSLFSNPLRHFPSSALPVPQSRWSNDATLDYDSDTASITHRPLWDGELKFRNFTPAPALQGRWPVPYITGISPPVTDDPFQQFSPGRFADLRGAVVSLYTPNQPDWLRANFADNMRNFFGPMQDHSDWIIFYSIFPHDGTAEIHWLLAGEFKCTEITDTNTVSSNHPSSSIYERLRALGYDQELSAVREYISKDEAVHILTVPVIVDMPRYLVRDPGILHRPDWLFCYRNHWSIDYALLSGAVFTHQLFTHPILTGYDYFIKMDMDLRVIERLNGSLFRAMAGQSCVFMHSMYRARDEDCTAGASESVTAWATRHYHSTVASNQSSWFHSLDYYWGNFMGGWLGWIHSDENKALMRFMFEDRETSGYFRNRWTDQPPMIKSIGMWFNLSDDEIHGSREGEARICDYSHLRANHVKHKWKPGQPEPDDTLH